MLINVPFFNLLCTLEKTKKTSERIFMKSVDRKFTLRIHSERSKNNGHFTQTPI
jgi:hypothetical protein